jgi:hypothetical protein
MGESVKRKEYLSLLSKSKDKKRRKLLVDLADNNEIKAVSEIILNILKGNVPLTRAQRRKLQKYQKIMRLITQRSTSSKKRKKLINSQSGGFIGILAPLIGSVLGSVVKLLSPK